MDTTFTVKVNDEEVKLKVKKPSTKDLNEAKKTYNEAFSRAVQSKAPLRRAISNILKEQGLWSDEKQSEVDEVQREINELTFKLHKGGMSLTKGREIAIEIRKLRIKLVRLLDIQSEMNDNCAEGQAENDQFNRLVSLCVVYDSSEKPYYNSFEDYLNDTSDIAEKGAKKLTALVYGVDEDYSANLPENLFLKKRGFVDDKLRLINKQGHLISVDGQLIDELGNIINEQGQRVDRFGHLLDADGNFAEESLPFTDDEGNEV